MKKTKISISMLQKLSRLEMKKIMAGSGEMTECCVLCPGSIKKCRDCGEGISCHATGESVTCGSGEPENLCEIA